MKNNYQEMEKYLSQNKPIFIYFKNTIKNKELEKLKEMYLKYNKNNFFECFETTNNTESKNTFDIEVKCNKCGNILIKKMSKTMLKRYFDNKKIIKCDDCVYKEKIIETRKEKIRAILKKFSKENNDSKEFYLNFFLNPKCDFVSNDIMYQNVYRVKKDVLNCLKLFDKNELKKIINNDIGYKNYLKTPYWKFISYYFKLKNNFKCSLCSGKQLLNLHHNSYENIGNEINNSNDVIVLCQNCHEKYHNK